jgi:4-amino-4-deoxy-L-arabinose transferase-like glycosyltransferase
MRVYRLGLAIDRAGTDEGIYWQTLRAMSRGERLYEPVFGSQPPMAQGAILPGYWLFGSSIWSARFSGVLLSLVGMVAAYVIGQRLGGRLGGLALMLIAAVEPYYLSQSRILQAEVPSIAFTFVAVALGLTWLDRPTGRIGRLLAVACGAALAISVASKLIGLAAIAPLVVIMAIHVVARWRNGDRPDLSVLLIPLGAVATTAIILLPFLGRLDALWEGVVTYHQDAAASVQFPFRTRPNGGMIREVLYSWIGVPALIGTVVALIRRDVRVLVPLAWLGASVMVAYEHDPLFSHHLVILVPPLLALAAFAFRWPDSTVPRLRTVQTVVAAVTTVLLLGATVHWLGVAGDRYASEDWKTAHATMPYRVVDDLHRYTSPDDLVVTDAHFLAALADRDTPAALVDTSYIRIYVGYLTSEDLIEQASAPEVKAVLIFPYLLNARLATFRSWVAQQFRPVADYGDNRGLWIRR